MKQFILKSTFFLVLFVVSKPIDAQQTVIVNGQPFKSDLEIAEAQISGETIMLRLYEIDKFNPKHEMDNCTECTDGKSLDMDIEFNRGFKFPIEETDSVFIKVSHLQQGLEKHKHDSEQVQNSQNSINNSEVDAMRNKAEVIKEKGMEITKLLQEGKITPQEAEKQLLALTQPFSEDLDNSSVSNIEVKDYKESSVYGFSFYNNETLTETKPFSGYLYIKEFNKERFVAEYRGEMIEQCVEKRAAQSSEEEKKCKSVSSQYLPDTKVLSEQSGGVYIDVSIKAFFDNR